MTNNYEIYKAINAVSKKINEIQRNMDDFFNHKCDKNEENIEITDGGLIDIADILNAHDESIMELATIISELSELIEIKQGSEV